MLSSTATSPSQLSYGNPRQITATASTAPVVMYTVPAGKKFQGSIYNNTSGTSITITPAGGSAVTFFPLPTSFPSESSGLVFAAGTIITSASGNSTFLIGVETDA